MGPAGFETAIPASKTHALYRTATRVGCLRKESVFTAKILWKSTSMDRKQNLTFCECGAGFAVITVLSWIMTVIKFMSSYN